MDLMQELPTDQWSLLLEKLKSQWPLNVGGYYALATNIKHPPLREAFNLKVYCPYGDVDNGFLGIKSIKSQNEKEYIIFSIDKDTNKLEEALASTNLIDWNSKVCIAMASSETIRIMERLKTSMKFGIFNVWGAKTFYLDKSSEPFEDVKCPPYTTLAAVDPDHIKQVDDVWPFRYPTSQSYFTTLTLNGLSYGLYSLDKKLLAWIFVNEYNHLCHLYCEPSHRRKGYAEFLMKHVVNESLKEGNDVYAYVVPGNQKAMELFTKLGFQLVDEGAWITVDS